MKLPLSQLSKQDLADLFEKSGLKDQYFFPRKVPCLFPADIKKKDNLKKSDQNEKSLENN